MKVVVAPDKFAGTMTAIGAAQAIALGWRERRPDDRIVTVPMSDGGPGFLDALAPSVKGSFTDIATTGPHGEPVVARLLIVDDSDGRTAYVEVADCCGLHLAPHPRRPMEATTAGLATVLRAAIDASVARVVVGVGGTASTDGGRGVVEVLGGWPVDVELIVATDVEQPLLGPAGAARSFAPQKGATPAEVEQLERRLRDFANGDPARKSAADPEQPGAGAGGGLAFGLLTLGGVRVGGGLLVATACGLTQAMANADLVITGEGALDYTSLRGKVVSVVGGLAMGAQRPCVALAGRVEVGRREAATAGLDECHSLVESAGGQQALAHPEAALRRLASQVAGLWSPAQP